MVVGDSESGTLVIPRGLLASHSVSETEPRWFDSNLGSMAKKLNIIEIEAELKIAKTKRSQAIPGSLGWKDADFDVQALTAALVIAQNPKK